MVFFIWLINIFVQVITLLVIIHVFISYFMSPYHPLRVMISRFVEPMLRPIRNILPSTGMLDFSPIVLLILVQILGRILINILHTFG